jgi:late competence protein required for DNA uptake (superfamily II DNA/RNA helicase)
VVSYMFNYLSQFREEKKMHIMFDLNGKVDAKTVHNFLKNKGTILITNDFTKNYGTAKDSNIIILSADNQVFNYKKLTYFCGKVGKGDGLKRAEVIFLANTISEEMERAKDMARSFNKEAWERKLLHY